MIVYFMGRISSVEIMARMDDYYENIRPYFHFLTNDNLIWRQHLSFQAVRRASKQATRFEAFVFIPSLHWSSVIRRCLQW